MELPSIGDQPRRSACDRCRAQKLRCERLSATVEDICRRCMRAGTRCLTTSARRHSKEATIRGTHLDPLGAFSASFTPRPEASDMAVGLAAPEITGHEPREGPKDPHGFTFGDATIDAMLQEPQPLPSPPGSGYAAQPPMPTEMLMHLPPSPLGSPDLFNLAHVEMPVQTSDSFAPNPLVVTSPIPEFMDMTSQNARRPQRRSTHQQDVGLLSNHPVNWNQRFAQISAGLLADLSLLESGRVAGTILFATPSNHISGSISAPSYIDSNQSDCAHYAVGRMIQSAEDLLRALRELRVRSGSRPTWPSTGSLGANLDAANEVEWTGDDTGPLWRPCRASTSAATTAGMELGDNQQDSQPVDGLLVLLIMTCHTTLMRICKGVFSMICDSLSTASTGASFEPILPTVQLDGFKVAGAKALQIRILLQVTRHFFDQLDEAMREIKLETSGQVDPGNLKDAFHTLGIAEGGKVEEKMRESIMKICKDIQGYLGSSEDPR
ncbi:uncharacterized protein DSM5745_10439 [Aspergillus mulundensis]|uniref:Zn(2)-C6 fungal-type domain-containing protein n=1 Tax=Aspergillus mulundensis TaxID=1810919 RepID=A0A3D8QJ42_9EURO|nr:hypothetical protein DSM5745_10439 [Aspergillus mulundensis]RDW61767.1 hypothetical protein DSM5745_10439 [Aspergillus mulundensis]